MHWAIIEWQATVGQQSRGLRSRSTSVGGRAMSGGAPELEIRRWIRAQTLLDGLAGDLDLLEASFIGLPTACVRCCQIHMCDVLVSVI